MASLPRRRKLALAACAYVLGSTVLALGTSNMGPGLLLVVWAASPMADVVFIVATLGAGAMVYRLAREVPARRALAVGVVLTAAAYEVSFAALLYSTPVPFGFWFGSGAERLMMVLMPLWIGWVGILFAAGVPVMAARQGYLEVA